MRHHLKRFFIVLYIGFVPVLNAANDEFETGEPEFQTDTLQALYKERIEYLELGIRNETKRRTAIVSQLDNAIFNISALEEEQHSTTNNAPHIDQNLHQIEDELGSIDININLTKEILEEVTATLAQAPKASVWQAALGNPELLEQQKQQASYRYLVHTTTRRLQQLNARKLQLHNKLTTVEAYGRDVSDNIEQLRHRTAATIEHSEDLELQLVRIAADIVKKQDRLKTLSDRAAQMSLEPDSLKFDSMQKKLPDPIEGTLLKEFEEPKAQGLLKWGGLLISAPLGEPFTAVSDGRVIFADEIHGLGNVAIVDHGAGFMTLYGMAELLMVQTNQFVLAGDPVGTVGESVGLAASALYFEIRHNADTVDPQDWLQMRQISQKNEP